VSLPTPEKLAAAAQALVPAAQEQVSILGFSLDASQIAAVIELAVDALCMKAWKQAHAAGAAAAGAITTEAQAEASQRKP
jgi:hypothetical protein